MTGGRQHVPSASDKEQGTYPQGGSSPPIGNVNGGAAADLDEKEIGLEKGDGRSSGDSVEAAQNVPVAEEKSATPVELESGMPVQKIHSVNNVSSIPDGGLVAWSQVMGSFFLFFNSWGIMNTFGVYQTYYETTLLPHSSASSISWCGSIQAFLLMLVGALTGPVYDAGYFRLLLLIGSFLIVFGHMMLSICSEYWQVLLAQAFCVGLGTGCLFVPGVAILSTYFRTKTAFAMGIAASGSSFGGVIYPIVLHKLLPKLGFGWSVRVIGFIALGTLLIPNFCMRVRVLPAKKRALWDWSAFKEPAYVLFVIGGFFGFAGLYMPFFYVQLKAIAEHIVDDNLAFYLLPILNAASTFGRIGPNFLADKTGPLNIMAPCALISGILSFGLIGIHDVAGLMVFVLLYGFFSGSFVSLPPAVLVELSPNRGIIGTRVGMCFSFISVGVLIGTPVGGAIEGRSGFPAMFGFAGAMTIAGGLIMTVARGKFAGWGLKGKA